MAGLLPSYIIRMALIRIGAFRGQTAAVEASYVKTDPTDDSVNASFTQTSFWDALVAVEQEIATAVAMNSEHPWRAVLQDTTTAITSGGLIPKVGISTATAKIIGKYGDVKDSVTPFRPLDQSLDADEISVFNANPNSMFTLDVYSFALKPPRLYHTRTGAVIDVCTYDFEARKTAIFADAELLFTEAENAYFCGLMSLLMNTDALLFELAKTYAPRYMAWLETFREGQTAIKENN